MIFLLLATQVRAGTPVNRYTPNQQSKESLP